MWADGVLDLGLSPQVFWSLTPREYDMLFDRHVKREERANRRAAFIAVTIANFAGRERDVKAHPDPYTVEEMLGQHTVEESADSFVDRMRAELDPTVQAERYLERERAADPDSEIVMSQMMLDALAQGRGRWVKLGSREGLVETEAVQNAIRRSKKR
jgi:Phage tail assembly chaperone protein, TAC